MPLVAGVDSSTSATKMSTAARASAPSARTQRVRPAPALSPMTRAMLLASTHGPPVPATRRRTSAVNPLASFVSFTAGLAWSPVGWVMTTSASATVTGSASASSVSPARGQELLGGGADLG